MPHDNHSGTFDRRRDPPEETGVLASRVISEMGDRLLRNEEGARQSVLDHLVRTILVPDAFDANNVFAELRGHRLGVDTIVDLYVPCAARCLGQRWVEDSISFADVTIGALRLQALLEQIVSEPRIDIMATGSRPRALVVLPQGEQHFLGVSVVAAQLRRIGCDVSISFDETLEKLNLRISETQPGVVMISCSRNESLEMIREMVQSIRSAVSDAPMIALGGAVMLDTDDLQEQTGVDIVTGNAKDAAAACLKRARTVARS